MRRGDVYLVILNSARGDEIWTSGIEGRCSSTRSCDVPTGSNSVQSADFMPIALKTC